MIGVGMAAVRARYGEDVVPVLQIAWVSQEQPRCWRRGDPRCGTKETESSRLHQLQTRRQNGLRSAFCFDAPFREQGFEEIGDKGLENYPVLAAFTLLRNGRRTIAKFSAAALIAMLLLVQVSVLEKISLFSNSP